MAAAGAVPPYNTAPLGLANPQYYFLHPDCIPRKVGIDLILLAGFIAFALCLDQGVMVSPAGRLFTLSDAALAYPHRDEAAVAVSGRQLIVYALVVPVAVIVLVDGLLRKTRGERTMRRLVFFLFGLAATVLVTAVGKVAAAALTPDFLARCAPAAGTPTGTLVGQEVCTGDVSVVRAGRMSFPNTVAAVSVYALAITAAYLRNHLAVPSTRLLPMLAQLAPLCGALWAGYSQYADYRAHGVDVLVGFAVGAALAALVQAQYLGGLKRSFRGEDASEAAEFLAQHAKAIDDPAVVAMLQQAQALQLQAAVNGGAPPGGAGMPRLPAAAAGPPPYSSAAPGAGASAHAARLASYAQAGTAPPGYAAGYCNGSVGAEAVEASMGPDADVDGGFVPPAEGGAYPYPAPSGQPARRAASQAYQMRQYSRGPPMVAVPLSASSRGAGMMLMSPAGTTNSSSNAAGPVAGMRSPAPYALSGQPGPQAY
jgi:diacylglycerol diphosphate phosphatase/phosphatidate phosphatase